MASSTSPGKPREKLHHTVTACVRCRQRKTRCDSLLPRCEPCERSHSQCEYFDSVKGKVVPRTYITSLQKTLKQLHTRLKALEDDTAQEPDHEVMARSPGLVTFGDGAESRFLGPSSGIAVTRYVMEQAKRNDRVSTIRQIVTDQAAQAIKQTFQDESSKPTSKVYPLISSVAAPTLPNSALLEQLVNLYMLKAQYMLPLLHAPTFRAQVEDVYNGSIDAAANFQVRLVIAISMQKLDSQYAGLADSYYLAALPYLLDSMKSRDLSTLQCFALIAQYSLLTPTRTAAYWVVGLAVKLCQELELCHEETILRPTSGKQPDFLEVDMRRRLFWIITSMEYGLSHSLGRPSAFGVSLDNIDVQFFHLCHDNYITSEGLLPGQHPVMQKCIAVHFFKMRLLQAEIRRTLYLKKREAPVSDEDAWFRVMVSKIDAWVHDVPKNDENSGLTPAWFEGRKNTMIISMYRPSPQIPQPSSLAAERCYNAAVFNIGLFKQQIEYKAVDITWIFTQAIFASLNTLLWSISYATVRQNHGLTEVEHHIQTCLEAIAMCEARWPGVRSAHQLYISLVNSCLKSYTEDQIDNHDSSSVTSQTAFVQSTISPSQAAPSPVSVYSTHETTSPRSSTYYASTLTSNVTSGGFASPQETEVDPLMSPDMTFVPLVYTHSSAHPQPSTRSWMAHDPTAFPAVRDQGTLVTGSQSQKWNVLPEEYACAYHNSFQNLPWLTPFDNESMQIFHQGTGLNQGDLPTLTEQGQADLMSSLEQTQFPDISSINNDVAAVYSANLP